MTLKTQCKPAYRFLSEAQIKAIHQATLEVLETTGVRVSHEEGIQLLKYAGCSIRDENIVQIPNWLVEESIRSAPSGIAIYNRKGEGAMQLEGHHSYYGLGTDLITTYDLERVETRPSLLKDVANAARVADYCEEIDFIASFALPGDVHTNLTYIACVKAQM